MAKKAQGITGEDNQKEAKSVKAQETAKPVRTKYGQPMASKFGNAKEGIAPNGR